MVVSNRYSALTETEEEINQVIGEWEKINMTIDSGAADTVGPPGIASGTPLRETDASRNKRYYNAANITPIRIHGGKRSELLYQGWRSGQNGHTDR